MTEFDPRYPIGKFTPKDSYSSEELKQCIERIESLPAKIEAAVKKLTPAQLETPYREGGWTLRQVIHHIPESHMNAYVRFKWTLTEETPTIKAYDEKGWSNTADVASTDPMISVVLLKALHTKWVAVLKTLGPNELARQYYHPDSKKYNRLDTVIAMYAWHGEHHLGHLGLVK